MARYSTGKTEIDPFLLRVIYDPRYEEYIENYEDPRRLEDVEAVIKQDITKYVDQLYQANKAPHLSLKEAVKGMPDDISIDDELSILNSARVAEAKIK